MTLGRRLRAGLLFASLALAGGTLGAQQAVKPQPLKSGLDFTGPEVRDLQHDDFSNPGMLWLSRGESLWQQAAGKEGKSCASCHGDAKTSMKGVAAKYPQIDRGTARLINVEGRIQQCQARRQQTEPFKYESAELLGLTAYIGQQSRGMPMNVTIDWQNRKNYEAGRAMYYRRIGQMNLSCAQCHQDNWGKKLGPETISQGHGVAYPIYRLEWQTMGSLHRRFRSCLSGVRAELLPQGSTEFLDLELYLAWREGGLPVETPGVRR
ncbi:MAG: SoxAX cytochrome complex subunit [Betaproteobacteria bacterium]|nr:SoxAX cytochrome complex subunit [Betaproteobacteria bacterium]